MRKIWTLFKREYRAAVRTKSFIISLVLVPILMGGGFAAMIIMENNKDTDDKHFVVIDHSGLMTAPLNEALEKRNSEEIFNARTGDKIDAAYVVEFVQFDSGIRTASGWPFRKGWNRRNCMHSSKSDLISCILQERKKKPISNTIPSIPSMTITDTGSGT
jgi:hypothetical protein